MPQVSRRFVKPVVQEYARQLLAESIRRCKDLPSAANLINVLLTKTEQVMLAKRVAIALMLVKGEDTYKIQQTLKVSKNTVYSVQNWLSLYGQEYQLLLKQLAKEGDAAASESERLEDEAYDYKPRYGINWKAARREKFAQARKHKPPPF